ncbi:hypothetical protein C8T65DRAFT_700059 [Cerioporus squamosus]|nr:hypothetical protein C8T65DRAFT_700059 [Cerioporus squamosus]
MSDSRSRFYTTIVRRVAQGEGDNPDTYILIRRPSTLVMAGARLRLYTLDTEFYTHLGWVVVEKTRIVGRSEVEFVIRRIKSGADELRGDRHFLVVDRRSAAVGWTLRGTGTRMKAMWQRLTKGNIPVMRTIPPTPPPTPPPPPASSAVSFETGATAATAIPSSENASREGTERVAAGASSEGGPRNFGISNE